MGGSGWKNFGCRWTKEVGGLENWTMFIDAICVSSLGKYRKPCLKLCSRRWLKPSLNLVSNLTPLRLWQLKTLLPEGRLNFKRLFLKIFKLSELRIFRSNLFDSMIAEGKKEFRKRLFYFELRNFISIPYVASTHSNGNNVKKVFRRMTFINFIEAA